MDGPLAFSKIDGFPETRFKGAPEMSLNLLCTKKIIFLKIVTRSQS